MKKRLLIMLLLLCLLLTALTMTAAAQYTTNVNGNNVRINIGIAYFCDNDKCKTAQTVNDTDYTINSFQAYTEDGKAKPLAEWKYGDGLVLSVSVRDTVCSVCKGQVSVHIYYIPL